ncbi:MAG: trigger factor [Paludibacteraceae bacterium]|jgi:trigger factor|nr:trigger factor [Paludibacteraceae bacterium]
MNVERKDLDAVNVQLVISVVKADYEEKVNKDINTTRKKVNMPGFRPGHVPASMVKKMYGTQILVDNINKLVSEELYKYIKDNNLSILGDPLPSENQKDVNFETDESFEFAFDLGIAPEIDATIDGKTKIPYYQIELTDTMIDDQVKTYASRFGSYSKAEKSEEKDILKVDAEEVGKENGIKLTDAIFSAQYIADAKIKKSFVGKAVGDIVTMNPSKAYDNESEVAALLKIKKEEIGDHNGDFNFTIKEITRYTEAEINQDLFDKVFGKDTVKDEKSFREKIKEQIQKNLDADSDYKFSLDARETLIKKAGEIQFPDAFLKRWAKTTNKELTDEKLEEQYADMINDLKWHLIQEKMAKSNNVKIEDQDVDEFAKKVALAQFAQYGMSNVPDDVLNGYVADMKKDQKAINNMLNGVMNEKINAIIKSTAKLEEKKISLEDFNKLLETKK